jgi:acetolactate synthase-1/2/3 large subunit
MKGTDAIAEILRREGVEFIACFPHNDLIEACVKAGIRAVVCRQERMGLAIADGFSRTTNGRRIGVFVMQHGPGAENAYPGIVQAFTDNVPLLILPGSEPTRRQGVRPNFHAVSAYADITKWSAFVNDLRRLPQIMSHAFYRLRSGSGGPVVVETPVDLLGQDYPGELHYQPVTGNRIAPDPVAVTRAVDALVAAQRPLIYSGQGVLFAEASTALVALAERLDAPVMTTMPGKSGFPEDHPLSLGASAITKPEHMMHFLDAADTVLAIGTSLTRTLYGTNIPKGKVIVHATLNEADINKEYISEHPVLGDARATLEAMLGELDKRGVNRSPGPNAEAARARKQAFLQKWQPELSSNEQPINQYRIIGELMARLDPDETIITHDAGTPREQLVSLWESRKPRTYLGWGKTTQLGFGLGAIMGAKLAQPDKLCINIMGDSAIGMVGMDIETAVRNRIGILTIIFNNGIMAIEVGTTPESTRQGINDQGGDYAAVAAALGAWSRRVTDPGDFASVLQQAIEVTRTGAPAVIECLVREGYIWPGRGQPGSNARPTGS